MNKESTYTDEEGNSWVVKFEVDIKVTQELAELDPNNQGLSYSDAQQVDGVQRGDNIICTDCMSDNGEPETASYGGSSTKTLIEEGVLHGLFHNIGYDDQYSDPKEIRYGYATGKNREYINQKRFDDAAKYILNDLKEREMENWLNIDDNGNIILYYSGEPFDRQ